MDGGKDKTESMHALGLGSCWAEVAISLEGRLRFSAVGSFPVFCPLCRQEDQVRGKDGEKEVGTKPRLFQFPSKNGT